MLSERIKHAFNKASKTYDEHCFLQQTVAKKLLKLILEYESYYDTILDLGCGTGLNTKSFAKTLQFQDFHVLDMANLSILKAKAALKDFAINFHTAAFENWRIPQTFSLIYANMSLHWSENLETVLKKFSSRLKKGGRFIFSSPLRGSLNEIRAFAHVNNFLSAEEYLAHELPSNFIYKLVLRETITQHFSTCLEALYSLKKIGANGNIISKSNNYVGKLRDQLRACEHTKKFNLTYHIGYFIIERV